MLACKLCDYFTSDKFSPKAQKHDRDLEKRTLISQKTQLSMHIMSAHNLTIEQYIVLTEYGGIPPRCACGFCEESPNFYRGTFSEYAVGHDKFEYLEGAFIKKFGIPTCLNCHAPVNFYRGSPRQYCSSGCATVHQQTGFCDPTTQQKIIEIVIEKYGVSNVSQLPEVAAKISEAKTGTYFPPKDPELTRARQSAATIKRWQDPVYRNKTMASLKIACNEPAEVERRRLFATEAMKDPQRLDAFVNSISNRFSKLHLFIRDEMNLEELGFKSEQRVLRYLADELHPEKKIIIEINGDYVHANPAKFAAQDIIRLPGNQYTAAEKWETDALKLAKLREAGYIVLTVWGSDDLDQRKNELYQLLGIL